MVDFIGVGGLSYDLVLRVDRLPASDDKIPGTLLGRFPGGFIANATCAAARLGLDTGYIGWVGGDSDGVMLRDEFFKHHIDLTGLAAVAHEPTPFTVIMVDNQGERAILIPSFNLYNQPLTQEQIALARHAQIVFTLPRDESWCHQLADAAHEGGGIFALDVESSSPMTGDSLKQAIELADVVFVTEGTLPLLEVKSIEQLAGPRWTILTAGKNGAYGLSPEFTTPVYQPAFRVKAVDTTGAGDSFHAALLAARHRGADLPEALAFASAAASLKVQHEGARGGLPTWDEVEFVMKNATRGNTL